MKPRTKKHIRNHNGYTEKLDGTERNGKALASLPRNKIARLPQKVRDSINAMLRERVTYEQIIARLGDAGRGVNKDNLSRWKKTGYRRWLEEEERRESAQAKIRFLLGLVQETKNARILQASQQIAALQVADMVANMDSEALKRTFQDDPANYVRLLKALPRLSEGGLKCERHRAEVKEADGKRSAKCESGGLPLETLREIEQQIGLL
jgi:hypothetical protein